MLYSEKVFRSAASPAPPLASLPVNVQSIVSRVVDPMQPAVVTLGKMEVGTRFNVIAENGHIEETVRIFDTRTRDKVEECLKHYAE